MNEAGVMTCNAGCMRERGHMGECRPTIAARVFSSTPTSSGDVEVVLLSLPGEPSFCGRMLMGYELAALYPLGKVFEVMVSPRNEAPG